MEGRNILRIKKAPLYFTNMHTQKLKTPPVLLIAFNRPDVTQKVFDEIRKAKPAQFFMAVDGPRDDRPEEKALVQAVCDIARQVDWECEIATLFREKNLGCAIGVESAITWFFKNVEEGIILEDDCVPHQSFFQFCQEMLAKYRDENKIMLISGDNFQQGKKRGDASYYFSIYPNIWGWATWRRAWEYFDLNIKTFPQFMAEGKIEHIFKNKDTQKYWLDIFQKFYSGQRKDTWDYQWLYAVWLRNGLTVVPNVNLISNIGFGPEATHTNTPNPATTNIKTRELYFPIKHPSVIESYKEADAFTFSVLFNREGTASAKVRKSIGRLIPHQIKKIIKNIF